MPESRRDVLAGIKRFDQLVAYLRDELGWPIERENFEDLFFDYTPDELGIEAKSAAKIQEIKRLRPLSANQPFGVFYVKFEPRRLPVVALRRILSSVTLRKRASANAADRAAWQVDDLLFLSSYGEGEDRQIGFAHFSAPKDGNDLPTLKVLGWDNQDTALHLDRVAKELDEHLSWPAKDVGRDAWREQWRGAFTLRHREVIETSKELSIRLAELARAIHDRIVTTLEVETERGPLTKLMNAFREALVHDLTAEGFADMYAQTITYGLLSARIADPTKKTADDFAAHMRTSPFLRELMEHFLRVGGRRGKAGGPGIDFDELGVSDVVELLDAAANMEAVVADFGDKNRQEDPVIHFYEHFLAAYNKTLKVQRGVFYTPQPVVSYIVRSVHELLQTEFGLADGLADTTTWGEMVARHPGLKLPPLTDEPDEKRTVSPDEPFVQILDPATGTATFLVEVIDVVHRSLSAKWVQQGLTEGQQLAAWNDYVPRHLLPRLHAYELMMAPYAIAHMKVGLKLAETRYGFGSEERARIYLTNALEPWQKQLTLPQFEALAHEAAAVNEIKRHKRFVVVIGNPPYAGHSLNNQSAWIVDKVYDYKRGYADLQKPGQAKWLQDDYVKFLRFAEWQIEQATHGVVGFITNHAWLDNPTFKGMRRHFLDSFDRLSVLDLHGNANKKERALDGGPDENVFEIKQGVAVSLLRRTPEVVAQSERLVCRSDLLGTDSLKYETLVARTSLDLPAARCRPLAPEIIFADLDASRKREYAGYLSIPQVMGENGDPAPGIVTTQDEFAISFSREEQVKKVEALLATQNEAEARRLFTLCSQNQWVYSDAKRALRSEDWREQLVPILYRPFDRRWTVYSRYVAVHRRERVSRHMLGGMNVGLSLPRATEIRRGWEHVFCARVLIQHHTVSLKEVNYLFPLWLEPAWPETRRLPNLSASAIRPLATAVGLAFRSAPTKVSGRLMPSDDERGRGDLEETFGPRDVFDFIYGVLHSGTYRSRYADFLKSDFARVPVTPTRGLFGALVRLGGELTSAHLLESPKVAQPMTGYVGGRQPEVERVSWSRSTVWVDEAGTTGFRGVPEDVWNFHIGGYQVCEKWLKDRKGRRLSKADIEHYQKIVVAISETIRIMKEIDEVIEAHGGWPGAFQTGEPKAAVLRARPFRPGTVEPPAGERYVRCVPLVPLNIAAGGFGEAQPALDERTEWVEVASRHRLRPGMFVSQVSGRSMEPAIPDGAWCLFVAPVTGSRQGRVVLVQLHDATDPETGERYTVKRYESRKSESNDGWRHEAITLKPDNPEFRPIELDPGDKERLAVVAEFLEVLTETGGGEARKATAAEDDEAPVQPGKGAAGSKQPAQRSLLDDSGERVDLRETVDEPDRGDGTRPRADELDRDELVCGLRALFGDGASRSRDEAIRDLARELGFERTGPRVREEIDSAIRAAVRRGVLANERDVLSLDGRSIEQYDRTFLKEQFLAALGGTAWTDRDEAARALARWLGFRRTGPAIAETVKSLINGLLREDRLEADGSRIRKSR